jgi:hypothetical protein
MALYRRRELGERPVRRDFPGGAVECQGLSDVKKSNNPRKGRRIKDE